MFYLQLKVFLLSVIATELGIQLWLGQHPPQPPHAPVMDRGAARPVVPVPNRGYTRSESVDFEYKVREYEQGYPGGLEVWLGAQTKGGWRQVAGSPYLTRFEWERQRSPQ